ncbi:hypothetical protein Patl1_19164 [Pistacia atlantica]|uniref:Uncharacterized protein n=1 Tax=Pistacia atlantica TaxID=434234 RepID=A0ACC1C059_9ROSI|nr:hypothetical protein Patl1_19164 [Pistacia atlantica]
MNNNLFPPLVLHYMIFTLFCILIAIPSSYCDDKQTERRPECGKKEFKITCEGDLHPIMEIQSQRFLVLGINTTDQTVTIKNYLPWDSNFCPERPAVSVNFNQFLSNYSSNVRNLSLFYDCTHESKLGLYNYTCKQGNEDRKGFYTIDDEPRYFPNLTHPVTCSKVTKVPILLTDALNKNKNEPQGDLGWLREILDMGLEVKYEAENRLCSACQSSRGICGSNDSNPGEFVCFCRDKPYPHACPAGKDGRTQRLAIREPVSAGSSGVCARNFFDIFSVFPRFRGLDY